MDDGLKNIVCKIAYDGTAYKGWQALKSLPSIESTLKAAVEKVVGEKVELQAASRTDAGVHATGQIVNFFSKTPIPIDGIKMRLNTLLPGDIRVLEIAVAPFNFHPTLDCTSKEYHYYVCNDRLQMPNHRLYSWHFPYALDFELMKQATCFLTGTLNFETFCNVRKNHHYKDYVREIKSIEIVQLPEKRVCFKIKGNRFLYRMARNLSGTLLQIGCGKMGIKDLEYALKSQSRTTIGATAKAHGLTLYNVYFTASMTPHPIRAPEFPVG